MIEFFTELFSYTFIQRALLVGTLVSLCAALLGVTLVLKRYSMIGDGLSHVGFGALCIAAAMNLAPLAVSVPVVILSAFFLLRLNETGKIKGDAAIALISSTAIALGVIATSLTTGLNTDISDYMFGSILAMTKNDVWLSVGLSVAVLLMYLLFYNRIFSVTFDEGFSKAGGMRTGTYNTLIALLTAVTIVVGMRIMGTMLISSLIIFPSLISMRLCKSYRSVTILSAILSVLCFWVGMILSFLYATPAGASIVVVNALVFLVFWLVGRLLQFRRAG